MFKRNKPESEHKNLLIYRRGTDKPVLIQVKTYDVERSNGKWVSFRYTIVPGTVVPVGIDLSDVFAIVEVPNDPAILSLLLG